MIAALLDDALEWLESVYPAEGCGLLVEQAARLEFWPCVNIATRPKRMYEVDPVRLLAAQSEGRSLRAIVHSHPDEPAEFSPIDQRDACYQTPQGLRPFYPGVEHIVVSVIDGRASGWRSYRFCSAAGTYVPLS